MTVMLGCGRRLRKETAALLILACCAGSVMASGGAKKPNEFFKVEELTREVSLEGAKFYTTVGFGPTGLRGWILADNLIVREIDPGSPADGVLEPSDVIQAVNGKPFGEDPMKVLGQEIMASEATGLLKLTIQRDGRRLSKELKLAKLPPLAPTWPFDCAKSKQLLANAARYLADGQNPDGGFHFDASVGWAMIGLVWLATDDPQYLQNCRRLIAWYHQNNKVAEKGTFSWGLGYNGIFMAEYCLKTGDRSVLPVLQSVGDRLAKEQDPRGAWTHGGPGGYGYVQGGFLNASGAGCWLAMELLDECGIHHREELERARHFFMRFVDNGTLPYGDQLPEFNGTGNSKDALTCLALHVKGEKSAAELFGHLATDFPQHRNKGHTGGMLGFSWGHIAGNLNPHRPDYQRCLDHWNWLFHACRRWDGGFQLPGKSISSSYLTGYFFGPLANTGFISLVYGVPNNCLRIFGKGESVFGTTRLSADLQKGVRLYRKLKFDELRQTVDDRGELGRQLLEAAEAKERDIAGCLRAARQALADGNPIKARTIAETLDAMCDGRLAEAKALLAESTSSEYAPIVAAGKTFEDHYFLIYTEPESRRAIEEIAADSKSGIYQRYAAELLAIPSDHSRWVDSSSMMHEKYWYTKETDPVAMGMIKRNAFMKTGGHWTTWFTNGYLREHGYIKDTFVEEWTALLPASGLNEGRDATTFAYRPVQKDGAHPEPGWKEPDFDDSGWATAKGPMTNARDSAFKMPRGTELTYYRIRFKAPPTSFSEWKLYIRSIGRWPPVAIYLNGHCIAWVSGHRGEYAPVPLRTGALKRLNRGENVLAVRTRWAHKAFDIGIYAKEVK